jgi:hypothetical protein
VFVKEKKFSKIFALVSSFAHPVQMAKKWILQFLKVLEFFPKLLGDNAYLFAFFFVGWFSNKKEPEKHRLKILIILLFAMQILVLPFYLNNRRLYAGFTPIFILLAFDFFLIVMANLNLRKAAKKLLF